MDEWIASEKLREKNGRTKKTRKTESPYLICLNVNFAKGQAQVGNGKLYPIPKQHGPGYILKLIKICLSILHISTRTLYHAEVLVDAKT